MVNSHIPKKVDEFVVRGEDCEVPRKFYNVFTFKMHDKYFLEKI